MARKNIKKTIMEHFFVHPTTKLRVRQIERKLKLPLPSVIRYAKELEKEQILKKTITANVSFYSADRSSQAFLLEKKLFNIKQLYKTGLIEHLRQELHNPTIVLFGSYAKGEDVEDSDIDLYIETPSKKAIKPEKFENQLKRSMQFFIHKNLKETKNPELANNIINGITLNGYLEVIG